jgi:hypothetical protein
MSIVIPTPGRAQGRIPQGHSLSVTIVDDDVPGGETVQTRIVYAEARNSEMGELLGSKLYGDVHGREPMVTGEWPAWAESVMTTRLHKADQL